MVENICKSILRISKLKYNMNKHDKISTRLSLILTKLNSGERFTLEQIADEFNVSIRTCQRDINERFSYLPIKKENGYYYLEEYCLGKLNFEDIKNFAALSGIKNLYPNLNNDFIVDLLNSKINQIYLIKGYEYENLKSRSKEFELLNIAIVTHHQIEFKYNGKKRMVNPYKLINTTGIWYLSADENGTLKTYTFSKISNLKSLDSNFKPNNEFLKIIKQNSAIWFSQDKIEVILEIDISIVEYFTRRKLLPEQKILEKKKDHYIVSTTVSYEEEILKIVRYWIPHIKIISPTNLYDKLQKQLKGYID